MSEQQSDNKPTSLIFHGANFIGEKLVELLTSQKSSIVLLDEFTRKNRDLINNLKQKYGVKSYDISGTQSIDHDIKRIDYVFILLDQFLITNPEISSSKFLSETNSIDTVFKVALKHGAKVILTTTIALHRKLVASKQDDAGNLTEIKKIGTYTTAELQRYAENLAAEYHDQAGLDIRIARLGETIGEGMPLESNSKFVDLIKEAITKPKITILGEGLDYRYYVYALDAVYGIIKATFSSKTNGEVFSLAYPEEISTLNLAYKVLEMNPKANEISFAEGEESDGPQQIYVPAKNLTKLGWQPKVEFDKALLETIQYFYDSYKIKWHDKPNVEKKEQEINPVETKEHRSEKITFMGNFFTAVGAPFVFIGNLFGSFFEKIGGFRLSLKGTVKFILIGIPLLIIYIGLIQPIIQIAAGTGLTAYFSKIAYSQALALETNKAERSLSTARYFSSTLTAGVKGLKWITYIPGTNNFYQQTEQLSSAVDHLTTGSYYLVQGLDPYTQYFKSFQPITSFNATAMGGSRTYQNELQAMGNGSQVIDRANVEISLATEALKGIDTTVYPAFTRKYIDQLSDKATFIQTKLSNTQGLVGFLPELLGQDGRKTYVILLQNPMELRSTGGWLTSYAVVGVEYGQVRTLKVDDVYNADGQLTIKVDPPKSMTTALGTTQWKLANSNWSPDFQQSADAAEYFLKQEDKIVKVDGVIAIDLEYIRQLIGIWGDLSVTGETTPVTKDSLYSKVVELHNDFTPGSTQKPVFLSNLANAIIQQMLGSSKDKWPKIAEVTEKALKQKHILVSMHNSSLQRIIEENGWSGNVSAQPNLIMPVEWNRGGNKANYFLDRGITVQSSIADENTLIQKVIISYVNRSTKNSYPEGDYNSYMRFYLPQGVEIQRVEGLNSERISPNAEFGLSLVSGNLNVPIKSTRTISITYKMQRSRLVDFPITTLPNNQVQFGVNFIKQPGWNSDPLRLEITYPNSWQPVSLENLQRELNKLIHRTTLESDKNFTVTWQRGS